jgi:hypothetical protein
MASSYLNIVTFLLTTAFYYMVLKKPLTYDTLSNPENYKLYISNNYVYLAVYLLLVMIIQFIVNSSIITTNCGGSISENMGAAGIFTFLPWTLIFGVTIIILVINPGFKSAFSDVIGYYYVSSSANELLVNLLVNQDVNSTLNKNVASGLQTSNDITPSAPPIAELVKDQSTVGGKRGQTGGGDKEDMQAAADLILKICGNTSILINQIVPSNFESYWKLLDPLKKDQYKGSKGDELRNQLFDLVVKRDNIGEALWYVYTGLLLTSIVQLKITSRGCASNPKTMEANYKQFQDQEAAAQQQAAAATSTTYTITN